MIGERPLPLSRLDSVWLNAPVFFVTTCVFGRRPILKDPAVAEILVEEWEKSSLLSGWLVGRYVIMPDHVHFFCASAEPPDGGKSLSQFAQSWKQWTSKRCKHMRPQSGGPLWQSRFFDHLLRSTESYADKWAYVVENPVRAGLVSRASDWPFQGELARLRVD